MYSAQEIAKYIIDKCSRDQHPISNLQLQKILYYIQRDALLQGTEAFTDEMEAWQFGPVVPAVYRQYCGFGAIPIRMCYGETIHPEDGYNIDSIIEDKRALNPWTLVRDTHKDGKAWSLTYRNGLGNHRIIPKSLIRDKG